MQTVVPEDNLADLRLRPGHLRAIPANHIQSLPNATQKAGPVLLVTKLLPLPQDQQLDLAPIHPIHPPLIPHPAPAPLLNRHRGPNDLTIPILKRPTHQPIAKHY